VSIQPQALQGRHNLARERSMPQSLVRNLLHLVYSTKRRQPWIIPEVQKDLWAYQAGIYRKLDCPAIVIGGVADHVHALFALSKNVALAEIVEEVKKSSSKWMKSAEGSGNKDFQWQAGYAAFSVSQSNVPQVRTYIKGQEAHHHRRSFQDEIRALLRRHRIEFDERYLWE
jgi:REP element-mobilizing transposase RayT